MKKVLVTGIGGPAGRSVATLLKQHGFHVIGVDMQPLVVDDLDFFQVPPALDTGFLQGLLQVVSKTSPALVIPTVTEELPILAAQWPVEEMAPLLLSPYDGVKTANDKYLTSLALSARSVDVPRFCLPSMIGDAGEVEKRIGWPCISKPRVGRGGRGVAVRMQRDFPAIRALSDESILQEFASGTDYAPNVYIDPAGMAFSITLEKTELKEGLVGNAKSVKRVDAPDVAELGIAAALALGLRGPVDVDIRRRQDGIPVVLEINARFGANILHAPEVFAAMLSDHLG